MSKTEKQRIKLLAIIIGVIVVLIAVVIALLIIPGKNRNVLDADFFKNSDDKIVLPIGDDSYAADNTRAKQMYEVFNISDSKIVSAFLYMEYDSEEYAKSALESEELKSAISSGVYTNNSKTDGKFVILELPKETYENTSVSSLKESVSSYEKTIREAEEENAKIEDVDMSQYVIDDEGTLLINNQEE